MTPTLITEILRELLQHISDRIHDIAGPHKIRLKSKHGLCKDCGEYKLFYTDRYIVICWSCFNETKNINLYLKNPSRLMFENDFTYATHQPQWPRLVDDPLSNERVTPRKEKPTLAFEEVVAKFQGKQHKTFPPELLESLGKLEERTKSAFLKHMRKLKVYGQYYNDIHLIHSTVTGIPCVDLSVYEDLLIRLYRTATEHYPGRPSAWYFLYRLLNHIGHSTVPNDIPNMTEVTREKVSEALRWVPALVINTTNGQIRLTPSNHKTTD